MANKKFSREDIDYLREQILSSPFEFPTQMRSYVTDTIATNPPTLHLDDIYDGRPERGTTLPSNPYNGYEYYQELDAVNKVVALKRYNQTAGAWETVGGLGEIPRVTSLPGSPATGQLVFHVVDATNSVVQMKRYTGSVWEVISEGLPPRVTSRPSSPTDGQCIYYVVDGTNVIVRLERYRTSTATWEVISEGLPPRVTSLPGTPSDGQVAYHVIETTNNVIHAKRYRTSTTTWETFGHTPPPRVSSLPGSPGDMEEVAYVADETNDVVWHLRYNSAGGTYKWEFIGGPPLTSFVEADHSRASSAYGDLTSSGPAITVPLAGDYLVSHGANIYTAVNETGLMSYAIGAAAASDNDMITFGGPGATVTIQASVTRSKIQAGLSASTALTAKYRTDAAQTVNFRYRWMTVLPRRVG